MRVIFLLSMMMCACYGSFDLEDKSDFENLSVCINKIYDRLNKDDYLFFLEVEKHYPDLPAVIKTYNGFFRELWPQAIEQLSRYHQHKKIDLGMMHMIYEGICRDGPCLEQAWYNYFEIKDKIWKKKETRKLKKLSMLL